MHNHPDPLSKILNEKRLGFVAEHGSRDRPVKGREG
jgi:hypothetical protein